jgi:SAM-dependent methyltransferase
MDPVPTSATLHRLYNDPAETFNYLEVGAAQRTRPTRMTLDDLDALLRLRGARIRGGRLLDVGCSTGAFLVAASDHFEVEGLEISEDTAEVARSLGFGVTTGTIEDLPSESKFDVITMLQVIEHIVRPVELLRQARDLLVPGGHLFMNTPAIDSASFALLGARHIHVSSFGHVSLFSRDSLIAACQRAGFEVVNYERCGGLDLRLHDLVGYLLRPARFRHRMALYRPRFYNLAELFDTLSFGLLPRLIARGNNPSYQRILLRKPGEKTAGHT